jgi:hypothetical protein
MRSRDRLPLIQSFRKSDTSITSGSKGEGVAMRANLAMSCHPVPKAPESACVYVQFVMLASLPVLCELHKYR